MPQGSGLVRCECHSSLGELIERSEWLLSAIYSCFFYHSERQRTRGNLLLGKEERRDSFQGVPLMYLSHVEGSPCKEHFSSPDKDISCIVGPSVQQGQRGVGKYLLGSMILQAVSSYMALPVNFARRAFDTLIEVIWTYAA